MPATNRAQAVTRVGLLGLLWLAGGLGCSDFLGLGGRLELRITGTDPTMQITTDADDWPQAYCNFSFQASAGGEGEAVWGKAKIRWYIGLDRNAPVDSQTFAASEMVAAFGSDRIAPGQSQFIQWELWANYPFEVDVEFLYTTGGKDRSTTLRRRCGPLPRADEPLPVVSYANATPTANLESGDTVTVGYSGGSSGGGIWAMTVEFWGAFESARHYRGELQAIVAGNMVREVPASALVGDQAFVTVYATDAFARTTSTTMPIGTIVDETSPTLSVVAQGRIIDPLAPVVDGRFFVGDTLRFTAVARDNNRIARILWETSTGQRDSAIIDDSSVVFTGGVPFRSDWGNGFQLRVTARDTRGLTASGTITGGSSLQVYPSIQRPTITTQLGGGRIRDIAYDLARQRAYVVIADGCCDSRIAVLSLSNMAEVSSIAFPGVVLTRAEMTVSGDSLLVPVGSQGSLMIMNIPGGTPPSARPIPDASPTLIAVAANGKAFMSQGGGPGAALVELDLATNQVRARPDAAGADRIVDITRSHDRSTLAVVRATCAQRYDIAADTFSACTPLERSGAPMTDFTGAHHVVGLDVYDAAFAFLRTVESVDMSLGNVSNGAITVAGDYVHHMRDFAGLLRSRVSDGALIDRTVMPTYHPELMSMMPDGSRMLIASEAGIALSRLTTIDLREELGVPLPDADAGLSLATPLRNDASVNRARDPRPIGPRPASKGVVRLLK